MGPLAPEDWEARWIAGRRRDAPWMENVARIWHGGDGRAHFHTAFTIASGAARARMWLSCAGRAGAWINHAPVIQPDVTPLLRTGDNVIRLDADAPAAALLEIEREGEPVRRIETSSRWTVGQDETQEWPRAEEVGLYPDPPFGRDAVSERPATYLRRAFSLAARPLHARLYATALGLYEVVLNGRAVGRDRLSPGWTDYHSRVAYQCYDVGGLLQQGENAISAILGAGWYAGSVAWRRPGIYGAQPSLLAQLEIQLDDGTTIKVISDGSWEVAEGAIRHADLQMGEVHDGRLHSEDWSPAEVVTPRHGRLVAQQAPPITVAEEVSPVSSWQAGPDRWIYDFGQNLVGWVRLQVRGERGQRMVLRHGEVLGPDDQLHLANLRSARQTDQYTLSGTEGEVFEPRFTVHGFRYLEVSGTRPQQASARVVHASMESIGDFACSHEGLNRLQRNIVWSQRGNFLSVPTDCPQRDERLGWTGDAQIFAPTAAFNMDVRSFLHKWLRDLIDAQRPNGLVPHVAPDVFRPRGPNPFPQGSGGWGDAIAIVPWALYRAFGDLRVAEELLGPIERWLAFLEESSEGLIRPAEGFGDWLSLEEDTPKDLIGTAFFAHCADLAARLARASGHGQEADRHGELARRVRDAFRDTFVRGGGEVAGGTQTAYTLALRFGLLEKHEVGRAAERLVAAIRERNWHLATGFLGTPHLLHVLRDTGHLDVAYRLLLDEGYPSWLHPVRHGGTTIWERWDGWSDHLGCHPSPMNSFNHYAFGAIGEWMYTTIAGLYPIRPGYREVRIHPQPGGGLTWARASHLSPYGPILVAWRVSDAFDLELEIPPGVLAEVWIPSPSPDEVSEGGIKAGQAEGVRFDRLQEGSCVFRLGSGGYRFRSSRPPGVCSRPLAGSAPR